LRMVVGPSLSTYADGEEKIRTMGDNITHVSDEDFQQMVLDSEQPVLVDFWAEWCVPCHMVSPVVEEIARDQAGKMKAVKLNVDDNPMVTRKYQVMSIPTLIVFRNGEEMARVVGARGKEAILREIQPHIAA
jgi:thioredoxin 1